MESIMITPISPELLTAEPGIPMPPELELTDRISPQAELPTPMSAAELNERVHLSLDWIGGHGTTFSGTLPASVSHRQFQTVPTYDQDSRGTCWAFAGCSALEAAYARKGVHEKLSEHYLVSLVRAWSNQQGPPRTSLVGFQGSADVIHHLSHISVPLSRHVPYIDAAPLQVLANSIPQTGGVLTPTHGSGTQRQSDWFEFDLRNVPLMGRWFAQYGVANFGILRNYSNDDLKRTLAAGYDVVVDTPGHTFLIYGYDDNRRVFLIKNSQTVNSPFETIQYENETRFPLSRGAAYYITETRPVGTQWEAMWVGRWETDHDGWRGVLSIRCFTNLMVEASGTDAGRQIDLGTWYGEDGRELNVHGHYAEGGRGLICQIGGQPFELYLHARDPYRAAGRCWWNNKPFGVVLSRGNITGAGSGFSRAETEGIWDLVHDGWRGQLRIGVDPWYVQASDGIMRRAWMDAPAVPHVVNTHIDFGAGNTNQRFELAVHTREDGLLGGITWWNNKPFPVEGRMAQNIYAITRQGTLNWYRNVGRAWLDGNWEGPKPVGEGWQHFKHVFGGGDGVVYAVNQENNLVWYFHDGRNKGIFDWQGAKPVGYNWSGFNMLFAGDGGVIYGIKPNGELVWYRHHGRRDGTFNWSGPLTVGYGWTSFRTVSAGPDGCLYGLLPNGDLLWYRHYGYDHGFPIWHGPIKVNSGWNHIDQFWCVGNGFIYGRGTNGVLFLWRHHGFLTGERSWTRMQPVGQGWSTDAAFKIFTT
ncbi:tachylectin-related carbohydrate-binding protein [Paraflavitalea sp. CAU 1676]|uniref:tachylectin-related carbohydrate-binding protein n=1 Tax=Paraflavitalea sp. CAU 1676 TaxID=3032598 RepID=UPI0023DCAB04|nr:tachylectin-related carbohydrate-binding protein [Paraflavitalea sp. CAU 1676]MDF2193192.1 tachylectin-related carbohydrate-binding protein [Paraflavitalea sp. CAU 1676]